jgi:HK97 family phage portal protein
MKSLLGGIGSIVAKTPVPQVSRFTPGSIPIFGGADAKAEMDTFTTVPEIFTIVDRNAETFASVDWRLYTKSPTGADEDRTEVVKHPALGLVNNPNPFTTGHEFRYNWSQHLDLVGEGYWLSASSPVMPGLPLELWMISPDQMFPVPDPVEFLKGWIYRGPDGQTIPLSNEEVFDTRRPHPKDPYRGVGPIQALFVDIEASRQASRWNLNFFKNSAEPGGIIEFENGLTDPEWDEFVARWDEQHKGVDNAHRIATIERGKWVNRSFSMRDMQFTELRRASREQFLFAFGFPKTMAGQTEEVNRATALAAKAVHADAVTIPKLTRFKRILNERLLPRFAGGEALEFDHDEPVPADPEQVNADRDSKVQAVATLVTSGAPLNESLELVGLPPIGIEDGSGSGDARAVAELMQKIYLAVDVVITADEARDIANRAGAGLSGSLPD